MNLQRIKQVAVCAALVALGVAGAGLFPDQPVAGKENKRQPLRGAAALDQLKQDGQYESLQAAMRQARFSVSRTENTPLGRAAWHAPNPAAGYDAYVTEAGVSIAVNDQSIVSLSLHSLGYGAAVQAVGPGEVSGDRQTINLTREGGVREWYVNGPDGLEQGFTLAEPLGARYAGTPLRLALQVSAGWRAAASEDGKLVTLRDAKGQTVEYGKLVVNDNLGRNIPARLTVANKQVVIEVEDSEAEYPLTIDPTFTLQQKLTAADAANGDFFGASVALYGDTLAVGADEDDIGVNTDQGSVYVFTRSGGVWTLQQKITAFDGAAADYFGHKVALYGDTLAVGAYGDDNGANANQGAAYVITRSSGVWTLQQKITAFDGAAGDLFGVAVGLSDYTLVVGAHFDSIGVNLRQGSAYVFTRIGTVWSLQKKLTAGDGVADDHFGAAVSLSGDTVVVGAWGANVGASHGAAYVFQRYGTLWLQEQKLFANDGAAGDFFGTELALDGDTLVVSAPGDTVGANFQQGSVYVYVRNSGVFALQQKLTANDGAAEDSFGRSIAIKGDIAVVSASGDDVGANADQGSVYVFTRSGEAWTQTNKITAFDGAAFAGFGQAVALSSDTLAVGAHSGYVNQSSSQGSVYAFSVSTCPALTFSPASLPNGVKGISYKQQVTVSGGSGTYQFALIGGVLPPGLSLTTYGLLSGRPKTPGTYSFTLSATDLNSLCSSTRSYTITILQSCPTLTLDPPTLPNGLTGAPYSVMLSVIDGLEPYKFGVKGKLPPGLSLNADGVLSGTPTQAGNFKFTVLVSDARGCSGSQAYDITVLHSDIEIGVTRRDNDGNR